MDVRILQTVLHCSAQNRNRFCPGDRVGGKIFPTKISIPSSAEGLGESLLCRESNGEGFGVIGFCRTICNLIFGKDTLDKPFTPASFHFLYPRDFDDIDADTLNHFA